MADHSCGRSSGRESWGQALTAPPTERIAAVATSPGRAGIGVVRVSGPGLSAFARALCGRELSARHATYTGFLDSAGHIIDQGIAIFFAAPHSYTGEDVLELQGHGGEVVQQLLLRRCVELGARLAEPGEFTRRAFLNGKLDLAQAEAVADLIEADSAEAARGAARSLSGEFSRRVQALAAALVDLRMYVEASIDFPEEEIELLERHGIVARLQGIADQLNDLLRTARQGSLLRSGLTVVILGRPNVGKSSLLNRLAGEEVAIVTAVPGTTRDTVRERIQIHGVPIHVIDTAGVRSTEDEVERLGIERTWSAASRAQLGLLVTDASEPAHPEDVAIRAQLAELPVIEVCNKIDLVDRAAGVERANARIQVFLSARTGAGIDLLREEMLRAAGWQPVGEGVFTARERHLQALKSALFHVEQAATVREQSELMAEELRQAHQQLGAITGAFTPDDLLGEIFSRFCIGK